MRFIVILITFVQSSVVVSQNLIRNGDFELRTKFNNVLLNPYSNLDKVKYWDNPNRTSPDIHKNGKYDSFLKLGQSKAYSGEYYVGLINEVSGFRSEYIEGKLIRRLKKDSLYCIRINTMADNRSSYFVASHYVAFYHKYYHQHDDNFFFLPDTVGFRNPDGSLITNTDDYAKLSNIYKAKGVENHLLLGPFRKDKFYYLNDSKNLLKNSHTITTYYYFDSLSIVPIRDSSECPCYHYKKQKIYKETESLKPHFLKGTKYKINNLKFGLKSSKLNLTDVAKDELIAISNILKADSLVKIVIVAHVFETDLMTQNKKLSMERAKVLKDYFILQNIVADRIEIIGFGSAVPIFENDSKEHQDKNTRIELQFD